MDTGTRTALRARGDQCAGVYPHASTESLYPGDTLGTGPTNTAIIRSRSLPAVTKRTAGSDCGRMLSRCRLGCTEQPRKNKQLNVLPLRCTLTGFYLPTESGVHMKPITRVLAVLLDAAAFAGASPAIAEEWTPGDVSDWLLKRSEWWAWLTMV